MKLSVIVLVGLIPTFAAGVIVQLDCARDLGEQIETAEVFSELHGDGSCTWYVSKPIKVLVPMTIRKLRVVLRSSEGIPMIKILARSVTMTEFELIGNNKMVAGTAREALVQVFKSAFHIARGTFRNSTKDGVQVRSIAGAPPITGGVLRDLVGRHNHRDLVSLTTLDGGKSLTRNIVVENIRAYGSRDRGAVEISDGVEDIFVRSVYAENCYYAVSIQDHGVSELETIRRVFVSNVVAVRSHFAVVSQVESIRHGDVSISRVIAKNCEQALELKNLDWVRVDDVRVIAASTTGYPVEIKNCKDLKIRDVSFVGGGQARGAILIADSTNVRIAGITLSEKTNVFFGITIFRMFERFQPGLQISQVDLNAATGRQINIRITPPHLRVP
ncbi:hypothetical protein NDN08_003317 [Rhodosorus marinus]|uniref:Right handed beta helix domain-containing protein n=1 Tax=Rhodosorus marinus TaxID=101924 RepID=A0AAV8UW62_9RHOD|nr:hypothetical protein NDN08_003317 [Rhodosorus marinus]